MSKTYAIADLHGRRDLLDAAFTAIAQHAGDEKHLVVTLGDYVDRGPHSRQVIQTLIEAQNSGKPLVCLCGNHEEMMHETLTTNLEPDWWVGNGGDATLRSYGGSVSREHLEWVAALPMTHIDKHRVFVHAGIDPTKRIEDQTSAFLTWFRYQPNTDVGYGDRHVVHGHTPNPDGPERYKNRTNLDTLAWRSGRLVIAVFDDDVAGGPVDFIEVRLP
jgi:serine/threonine protein phosphatase 1